MNYDESKTGLIDALSQAVAAHESGAYGRVELGYEEIDVQLEGGLGPEYTKLFVALSFWDGWIDARNHDWQYYEPIGQTDWPRLAREIIFALETDQEIQNEAVNARFSLSEKASRTRFLQRIVNLLSGKTVNHLYY